MLTWLSNRVETLTRFVKQMRVMMAIMNSVKSPMALWNARLVTIIKLSTLSWPKDLADLTRSLRLRESLAESLTLSLSKSSADLTGSTRLKDSMVRLKST